MNRNGLRVALWVALVLPLVVIALGIVRAERHLASAKKWAFDVTGYDPRDLLRGHYIQYRLELHAEAPLEACDDDFGERCCLCLRENAPGQPPRTQRATCETARAQCDGHLQTRYLSDLTRYYISEARAVELTQRFQDAARIGKSKLMVAIDQSGKPQIDVLLINGQRIEHAP